MAKINNTLMNMGIIALIVTCLAVVSFVAYQMYGTNAQQASTINTNTGGQNYQSTCELGTDVTVTISETDIMQPGTTVAGVTEYASVNGGTYSTTTTPASVGAVVDYYLLNGSAYHSTVVNDVKIPCVGEYTVEGKFLANTSLTLTMYNQYGTTTLTDGGGTNNLTVASGESATSKLRLQAENLKGTQKMRCVLESSNTTKMKTMRIDGLGAVAASRPSFYSVAATSSATWAFDINSVEGATPVEGYVYMEPKTSQDMSGSYILVTCYTYEYFLDSVTGKVVFDIEDSQGNMKSLGKYRGTYYID